jgi:hypothetical protein
MSLHEPTPTHGQCGSLAEEQTQGCPALPPEPLQDSAFHEALITNQARMTVVGDVGALFR